MKNKWKTYTEDVIKAIDFISEYEALGVTGIKGVGDSRQGFCPIHNDQNKPSFSFFATSGRFKCFAGCGEGSFADFVTLRTGKEFKDVIKEYGDKYRIQSPESKKTPICDAIPAKYAEALLNAREQLLWLMEARGLTMVSIKELKIGWHGDRYSIPVYDRYDRLVNIRLYKRLKADSKEEKIKSYTYGKHRYGEARLYGLAEFLKTDPETPVIICEGEWDRILLRQNGFTAVTGTAGCNTWKKEWNKDFKDRHVYICYDNDDEGRKGALNVCIALHGTAKTVHVIALPEEVGVKGDVTDFFARLKHSQQDFQDLMVHAHEYEGPENQEVTESSDCPIEIVGTSVDKRIVLFSRRNKTIFDFEPNGIHRRHIILMAGKPFADSLESYDENGKKSSAKLHTFIDNLIDRASLVMLENKQTISTGLYKPSPDSLLAVSGRSAYLISRDLTVTEITTPIFQKYYIRFCSESFFDISMVEDAQNLTENEALAIFEELRDIIYSRFKFQNQYDVHIIAAAIMASILMPVWDWKFHVWLCGRARSGKSTLLNYLMDLFGELCLISGDATKAGIQQGLDDRNLILLLDEMEKKEGKKDTKRKEVVELLRNSNSRGSSLRGKANGKDGVKHKTNSIAWCASIENAIDDDIRDATRFFMFNIEKCIMEPPSLESTIILSKKLFSLAFYLFSRGVESKARSLRKIGFDGVYDSRIVDNYAPIVAIISLLDKSYSEKQILDKLLSSNSHAKVSDIVEDEITLFDDLLSTIISIESEAYNTVKKSEISVKEVILSGQDDWLRQLERKGIKVEVLAEDRYILAMSQKQIRRYILANTKWSDLNIKSILQRLPGAHYKKTEMLEGDDEKRQRLNTIRIPYPLIEAADE